MYSLVEALLIGIHNTFLWRNQKIRKNIIRITLLIWSNVDLDETAFAPGIPRKPIWDWQKLVSNS